MEMLLTELLDNLIRIDEFLVKQDINGALKYVHESIAKIRDFENTSPTSGLKSVTPDVV